MLRERNTCRIQRIHHPSGSLVTPVVLAWILIPNEFTDIVRKTIFKNGLSHTSHQIHHVRDIVLRDKLNCNRVVGFEQSLNACFRNSFTAWLTATTLLNHRLILRTLSSSDTECTRCLTGYQGHAKTGRTGRVDTVIHIHTQCRAHHH